MALEGVEKLGKWRKEWRGREGSHYQQSALQREPERQEYREVWYGICLGFAVLS